MRPRGSGDRRLPIRVRLTLSYAGMVTGCGAAFTAIVYLFMRYVPSYLIIKDVRSPVSVEAGRTSQSEGVAISSPTDFLQVLLVVSLVALAILAVLSGIVGWIVAGRIIKPLAAINAAATRAATGALDHRVGLQGPRDEIRDLSDTFDRMLGSLERAFATHRRFAANASHELRTPLATTKTMIDVTLANPQADAGELRALAERVREVNQSSIETVNALLDLADVDSGTLARRPVDLAPIAAAVVRELSAEAKSGNIDLPAPTGTTTAVGDPVLIRQAISNLARNAVRHNRSGGHASVRLSAHNGSARVTVTNTGPPVSLASLESLTEPFVRGAGRTLTRKSGHGLGLAIVSGVALAHDGALRLNPNPNGGLTVHLDLPHASSG
ncbi:two-component system sensor histidine kinase VanS [Kibdelosporangium banguiense]|uniref:histidine kinase n=1 Tax=Kibdelosporangium banguiense TaxID=1365924 RepID=A0ABS4TVG3_9PSEU|nr:HAMP domain-containing sensor histidine kinase [Kibdelosporangium banguiense]MBP2328398.1 two-component system sensor histidine kinase VanS [Kibdelosporangium banguiense]